MNKHKLPIFRKKISDFILNEEGKITKQNIVKIGLYLLVLRTVLEPGLARADHENTHSNVAHSNYLYNEPALISNPDGGGHNSALGVNTHNNWHNSGGWC